MATKCYTISELLAWKNILISDCEDRTNFMNEALEEFFDLMYGSPLTKSAEWFVWNWVKTMQLIYDVYKIDWFYWYGSWCTNGNCFIKVPKCIDCHCPDLYQIKMEQSIYWLDWWQYKLTYSDNDNKRTIDFNIPNGIDTWYVVYSINHRKLTSYSDTVCIDPRLTIWLKLIIRRMLAERDMEINLANYYAQRFTEWKTRQDKNVANNLISVITSNVW